MATRLLCIGDLHLGRASSGLSGLEGAPAAALLGPAAALRRAVDLALAEEVDAVLFAGPEPRVHRLAGAHEGG